MFSMKPDRDEIRIEANYKLGLVGLFVLKTD